MYLGVRVESSVLTCRDSSLDFGVQDLEIIAFNFELRKEGLRVWGLEVQVS